MTSLGGAVGFGVVFLLAVALSSAIGCGLIAVGARALAARGPGAERRAAALAALGPPVIGAFLVAALAVHSVTTVDHCRAHDHHAHLCLAHGGAWLARPWAVAVAGAALVVTVARAALLLATLVGARARVRALAEVAQALGDIRVVDSPRRFCFVTGVRRPAIYASTAALRALGDDEQAAMLAHERAHVRAGDLRWRRVLDVATLVAAPLAPGFLAGRWDDATERLRDRDAARDTDPTAVARALVAMCRGDAAWVAGMNYAPAAHALTRRVEAVLAMPEVEPGAARHLATAAAALGVTVAAALAAFVDPIHHALETLLG
jgi:Zn-dependent protease with chaperone function